ncbi:IS66 family transposase [Dechloromonas sp. A34]|uniref:IS66 family transposase n=1 Tax=Dechloromonas sp. A34 TaxID=447588 RepID=UPI002248F8C0|nr:IS66 family transposase [Dechloromonas sp. A34]
MSLPANLDQLNADELRRLLVEKDRELDWRQAKIDKLTHELAMHKRWRFGVKTEHWPVEQAQLFEETLDADLAAMEKELEQLSPKPAKAKGQAKRQPLPANLPRTDIHHEPESAVCPCGCTMQRIGEDVAEKLDYTPGVFTVERHIRGKWVCGQCETLTQAPVPAHVIDKGIPTTGLLAQVLIAKYLDHLPLYRQEAIFGRAGLAIPQSTLAQWVGKCGVALQPLVDALKGEMLGHRVLHADETPVAMLDPGAGKTHRAYLWSYSIGAFEPIKAVIYDFAESRAGRHAQAFLGDWRGTLVCDDYSGYKALLANGLTEAGCMAHARRKFFDLHSQQQSLIAGEALEYFGRLYGVERETAGFEIEERRRIREAKARPIADDLHAWLSRQRQRQLVPNGSATARAIDYSLKRWGALTYYLSDGQVPIDNNWIENQIRPIALGRKNWLFAGSLRAGKRAAAIMSLIQSAKLNGHEPLAYLKDVLTRLPTQPASRVAELLPHCWQPQNPA